MDDSERPIQQPSVSQSSPSPRKNRRIPSLFSTPTKRQEEETPQLSPQASDHVVSLVQSPTAVARPSTRKPKGLVRLSVYLVAAFTLMAVNLFPFALQRRFVDPEPLGMAYAALKDVTAPYYSSNNSTANQRIGEPKEEAPKTPSPYTHERIHNSSATHRFAYAYVIGGCMPEDAAYRNYLYDIMISTYTQREENSTADVIVFIQMSFKSAFETLPAEDMRLLNAMDILVRYIPKAEDESFYRIMLDKFRVLSLVEYDRVLFMDGDVLAKGNLDYIFELSVAGVLKENVVIAGGTEPANGGFFMLAPKKGSEQRIHEIIDEKETRGAQLPYPHWDDEVGWGHKLEEGDYYQFAAERHKKMDWSFYGAFADQGLLFYWVKYVEKSVSFVFKTGVQHWGADAEGKVVLEERTDLSIFGNRTARHCWPGTMKMKPCKSPHSDFVHFTGRGKPWLSGPPEDLGPETLMQTAIHFWFQTLSTLNDKMDIGLDFGNWRKNHRPLLGMYPLHIDAAKTKYKPA